MEHDKNINSNEAGAPRDGGRNPERFFRKYVPSPPGEPDAQKENLFENQASPDAENRQTAFSRSISSELPPADSSKNPEAILAAPPRHHAPAFIWGGLVCIAIISLLLIVRQTVLHEKGQREAQPHASNSSEAQSDAPGAESATDDSDGQVTPPVASPDVITNNRPRIEHSSWRAASSSPPVLLDHMLRRARELEGRGMLDQAAQEYRAVLIKFPDDQTSQSGLNRIQTILSERRRDDISRADREAGLKEFRFRNYTAAETHLIAAVNAGRVDTPTLYALGMSQVRLGHYSNAQMVLNRCITANPNYGPALVGLAQAHIGLGEKDQALALLKRALDLGGGAEFTPAKIKEMISSIDAAETATTAQRPPMFFYAYAVHRHSFPLLWCRGELTITDSHIRFNSNKPSHSFYVSSSDVAGVRASGDTIYLSVNGKAYTLVIEGRSVRDFMAALSR